jgi:outer membrane usher protein
MKRFVIGDFYAYSGNLGSGALMGGFSLSRNFSTAPFFIKYPGMDISGMLYTPSDVEIYTNDMLLKRARLSPGEFEFMSLPNVHGAGELDIVIKDAFGREEKITSPYYVSTALLKPGLHDYSYNVGFRRKDFGRESFKYSDPAFLGYHRIGFSRIFTGGLRAEADKNMINAGPTATLLLGNLGEIDSSFALSRAQGRTGYGFFSNYSYAGRHFNWRFFAKGYSRDYANLAFSSSDNKPRFEGSASAGFGHKMFGSLSIAYSVSDLYCGTDIKKASMFYSRRLLKNVSFNIEASRTDAEDRIYEVFAGLTFILGKATSASMDYRVREDYSRASATLQENPPLGTGFGYRVSIDRTDDDRDANQESVETGGNGFLQYRGPQGIYSAEYRRVWGEDSYTVGASGGVAFINSSAYFTRPITDGFALVKVDDLNNVRVRFNNQEAGTTNKNGEVIIPGLISYYPNSISFDDTDCPVNYLIPEIEKLVSVPFRGGGVVLFDLQKLQAFTGRLSVIEKGVKTSAEYWGLKIQTDVRTIEAVVGKRGEFYLENIPAGTYAARLFENGRACDFSMTIPASKDAMVDMGEVICEMD